jgi:ABC-type nitrate/sulfonate/bicarbonate transport system permease component
MANNFSWLFSLRGDIKKGYQIPLLTTGIAFIFILWLLLTLGTTPLIPSGILPSPLKVIAAFNDLVMENDLVVNLTKSYALNIGGYLKALLWSLPVGFLIGLFPLLRGMFLQIVNAFRFVPLTAVTSLFIVWFGIGTAMKMNFLAFGIFIYLVPTIIQRIDEVDDVYLTSIYTLGANKWQTFRHVYWPSVMSKLSDDIRVLTAISWTYIIVIENIGSNGGIGFLMLGPTARQGRVDKLFALLIIVILVGVFQDKLFRFIDKMIFPHKYQLKEASGELKKKNTVTIVMDFVFASLFYIILGVYLLFILAEYFGILGGVKPLSYFFDDKVSVMNTVFLFVLASIGYKFYKQKQS